MPNPTTFPAVAIFDLDGTVTRGDTFVSFLAYVLRSEPLRLRRCLWLPYNALMFALGRISHDGLKVAFLSAVLKGFSQDEIGRYAASFATRCARDMVKPAALAKISWHRANNHRLILASASVDLYVPLLASLLGFDETICTRVEWADGRLTGHLSGPNLRGLAKLDEVRKVLGKGPTQKIFAYSDSHLDLPLLTFADYGVAVDPDRLLLTEAKRSAIAVEFWQAEKA